MEADPEEGVAIMLVGARGIGFINTDDVNRADAPNSFDADTLNV